MGSHGQIITMFSSQSFPQRLARISWQWEASSDDRSPPPLPSPSRAPPARPPVPSMSNPDKFSTTGRLSAETKREIILLLDFLTAQRTEDAARSKHIILCQNGLSDDLIEEWRGSKPRLTRQQAIDFAVRRVFSGVKPTNSATLGSEVVERIRAEFRRIHCAT